jgi:hypothetical protein
VTEVPSARRERNGSRLHPAVYAGLVTLAACAIPEAPEWEVDLSVPFTGDSLTIADFLPEQVDTATADGERVFVVEVQEDSIAFRLADICEPCKPLHGQTIVIPPFDSVDSLDLLFPVDLYSIEVRDAQLGTEIENELNFNLLQQHSDPDSTGSIALAVRDIATGTTIDSVLISGADGELPAGSTRLVDSDISNVELSEGIRVVLYIHSPPDTQLVTIDTTRVIWLKRTAREIVLSAVTVVVQDAQFDEDDTVTIDQRSRDELAERYVDGTLEIALNHDVEVDGFLDLTLAATRVDAFSGDPNVDIPIGRLAFTPQVVQVFELTADQIDRLAAFPDTFFAVYSGRGWGTRTGPMGQANLSRITPDLFIRARLKLGAQVKVGG